MSSIFPVSPPTSANSQFETSLQPTALYSAAQVRELDRLAIEEQGIPGIVLMKRAARAVLARLLSIDANPVEITVYCGAGNNAGDGYLVAALAHEKGFTATVIWLSDPQTLSGDARTAYNYALAAGVVIADLESSIAPTQGYIVDALLGAGLRGEVRDNYCHAIEVINASGLPVIAVDIPSGLSADTGMVMGACVKAATTVTFIGSKRGLLTGQGPAHVGDLHYASLDVPAAVYAAVVPQCQRLTLATTLTALSPREADAHKGRFGHVLVLGGDHGMGGAALMAAEAVARSGAGLVSVATQAEHVSAFLTRRPEIMAKGVDSSEQLNQLLAKASVLVLGPGLGQSEWSRQLFKAALSRELPMVVDADALNLLALESVTLKSEPLKSEPLKSESLGSGARRRSNWVLTPHPGEASRLLGWDLAQVMEDRFATVDALVKKFGGTVVLKGAGSLVASNDSMVVGLSPYGNPGMATGGMGDVLSGIIGGLLAQHLTPINAAQLGVVLHGMAADLAAQEGERGTLATDLMPHIRHLLNSKPIVVRELTGE